MGNAGEDFMLIAVGAVRLFSLTYITRWISFASQSYMLAIEKPAPASAISISISLVFPLLFIAVLWPLGLTGMWLNLAAASVASAVLSVVILIKFTGINVRKGI